MRSTTGRRRAGAVSGDPARTRGDGAPRYGIARVISKRGFCSRTEAAAWVRAGRVRIDGRVILDPEFPTRLDEPRLSIDGARAAALMPVYLMLNKPRGLVTTACDEQGRDTVYRCLDGATLGDAPMPWLAPVGRLDKASEGLLLFTNDPQWAARITDPEAGLRKTYHVQIDQLPDDALLEALRVGVDAAGERLSAVSATLLRAGERHAWLEIVLDEGRNRQIRRLLSAFDVAVLRLVRVAIGGLPLGDLAKGAWRPLTVSDLDRLFA